MFEIFQIKEHDNHEYNNNQDVDVIPLFQELQKTSLLSTHIQLSKALHLRILVKQVTILIETIHHQDKVRTMNIKRINVSSILLQYTIRTAVARPPISI